MELVQPIGNFLNMFQSFYDCHNIRILITDLSMPIVGMMQMQKDTVTDCTGKQSH